MTVAGTNRMTTFNVGNTTVRNPERLLAGLQVFADGMHGRDWLENEEEQIRYWGLLLDAGVISSETEEERASQARKWYSALRQLGFVRLGEDRRAYVTEVGRALLDHPETQDLIFLRQLMKYKIASPIERTRLNGVHFRPFVTYLRFLKLAQERGLVGLTRDELALFVVTTMTEDPAEIQRIFDQKIVPFREGYAAEKGMVAKRAFAAAQFGLHAPATPSHNTLKDYADSNSRYARISGLVTLDGTGGRYKLVPNRLPLIDKLLTDLEPIIPDEEYLSALYDPQAPRLPIDDAAVVEAEIAQLEADLQVLGDTALPVAAGSTIVAQQAQAQLLRTRRRDLSEFLFYRQQRDWDALDDIRELLVQIKTKTLPAARSYAPAFLEWALWRLLLAVNDVRNPIPSTRGFRVDDGMVPLHHAASGAADCQFEYDDDAIVVEATLTANSRQVVAENESVRRHVAKAADALPHKNVLGLFVAEKVDVNTYDEFHHAKFRLQEDVLMKLTIVPLTIDDVISLIDAMKAQKHLMTSAELLALLRRLNDLRSQVEDGVAWRNLIRVELPNALADLSKLSSLSA